MKTKRAVWTFIAASVVVAWVLMHFTDLLPSMNTYLRVNWVSWSLVGLFALAGAAVLLLDKTEDPFYTRLIRGANAILCFMMAGAIYLFFLS